VRRVLLDTNAYVAFKAGNAEVIAILQHADTVGMSAIVLGELTAGFLVGSKYKKNLTELNEFLNAPRINMFSVDETTVAFYARVYASLRRKGKPIPSNDLWIAAIALQQGCKLCTFDKHFQTVESLVTVSTVEEFLL